jgi:transcriptional regulator with XRE-family HTH domain
MQSELDILVWKNVWRLAQEKGWNKSELARRVGTPPQTINNICKATGKGIGPNLRARFAKALGVSDTDLTIEQPDASGENGEYRRKNKKLHDSVEEILNSDDTGAVSALSTGVEGILLKMEKKDRAELLLEQMVLEMQFHRKETQAQMELLREYLADPGENSGVPPGSEDLTGGTRAKKAV